MRDFDSKAPKKGYENAPRITAAQMDRFLYQGLGASYAQKIASLINAGQSIYANAHGIDFSTDVPEKPAYLPIKRKVRWHDLEDGCVLRYCGNAAYHDLEGRGMLVVGDLYTIRKDARGAIAIPYTTPNTSVRGTTHGVWKGVFGDAGPYADPWEFVSNPNYVHGFRIGETVYSNKKPWGLSAPKNEFVVTGQADTHVATKSTAGLVHKFPPAYLTRDPTKAYGYKAPVEYKVKDGVAKEGDTIWWLPAYGDPEKVTIDDGHCQTHAGNIRAYPEFYQLREPQKVWDYKNK